MEDGTTQSTGVSGPQDLTAQFESIAQGLFNEPEKREPEAAAPQEQEPQSQQAEQAPSEQEPAEQSQSAENEPEEPSYRTIDEFLAAQKVDPESFKSLPVTVKIDGQERQVPLHDVIKSFQLEGHVNNKSIELSNAQKQFQEEQNQARQIIAQQVQQNATLGNMAMQQLTAEFQRVDWNALRATDPAQYAALHADFQQRQGQIQQYLSTVTQQQQMMQQEEQTRLTQKIEQERQLMLQKNPEWSNPEKFSEARSQIASYAKEVGFSEAELGQVYDHRLMQVLRDAASYRALQAKNPETLKKVRQAPPMAKAGTRQNTSPDAAKREAIMQRLRQNPRDQDVQAAAFSLFA